MWWWNTLGSSNGIKVCDIYGNRDGNRLGICDGIILEAPLGNPIDLDDSIKLEINDGSYDGETR